jgi:hypothetical protein
MRRDAQVSRRGGDWFVPHNENPLQTPTDTPYDGPSIIHGDSNPPAPPPQSTSDSVGD